MTIHEATTLAELLDVLGVTNRNLYDAPTGEVKRDFESGKADDPADFRVLSVRRAGRRFVYALVDGYAVGVEPVLIDTDDHETRCYGPDADGLPGEGSFGDRLDAWIGTTGS